MRELRGAVGEGEEAEEEEEEVGAEGEEKAGVEGEVGIPVRHLACFGGRVGSCCGLATEREEGGKGNLESWALLSEPGD